MQTLFAFQQVRVSNQQIAWEHLKESSKELSETQSDLTSRLEQSFKLQLTESDEATNGLPEELEALLDTEVSSCLQQTAKDLHFLRSQMLKEVESIHDLFLWVLGLFLALADFESAQLGKKKSLDQGKQKVFLADLQSIEFLKKSVDSRKLPSWSENQDRISQWYKEIKNHQGLTEEVEQEDTSPLDKELREIRYIFKSILWKSESFQNFFEEHHRDWVEDKDIIKSLINKTLKSITEEGAELAPLSYQWDDDKQFFIEVFDTTIKHESWSEKLIAESAKNWKMDRIAQVDMILLKMGLSEMINFPSIPVKVTINEYIEMSKKYSTPKSKKFINGILNVLANDLTADGTIKKSGRGLIDNK